MSKPLMYVVVNKDLNMSLGKTAAQVAHAVSRVKSHDDPHTVIVLEGSSDQIKNLYSYLKARDFKSYFYIDEGANEVPPFSITALATEAIHDNGDIGEWQRVDEFKEIFSYLNLLTEKKKGWRR